MMVSDTEAWKPGQDTQAVATARLQGQDPDKIHCPAWGVIGNLGDSICYAGVPAKVDAIQAELRRRVVDADLPVRVIAPGYAGGISDGQRNGTPQMRYSLIGRETTNDGVCLHLEGSDLRGVIAVVACDKPPVGTLAAILEHNVPAVILSDGSIRPGIDSLTGEPIDIISCFQAAADSPEERRRMALEASPGHGSCGGMFTYNTMQSFIATCGMEPLHMVSPASEDLRRIEEFPAQLLDALEMLSGRGIRPRDIVTAASLRNATLVAIAMGGSTNVVLHAPELARAAGIDYWRDVITQEEFNRVSRTLAGAGERTAVRPVFNGRYRRPGRPAGDRARAARGRAARWQLPDLHRRDARPAGRPARPARSRRRGHPPAVGAVQADRRAAAAAAATSPPAAAR